MLETLNPFPRFASNLIPYDYRDDYIAHDCRLLYVTEGSFRFYAGKESYLLSAGDALYLPPYTPYRFAQPSRSKPRVIIVNLDLADHNSYLKDPLAPMRYADYDGHPLLSHSLFAPFDRPLYVPDLSEIEYELRQVEKAFWTREPYYRDGASARLKLVLLQMMRRHENTLAHTPLVSRAIAYIRDHYATPLTNDTIAQAVGCHPYYLSQKFKQETGVSLRPYLIDYRLRIAQSLLRMTDEPISSIALNVGFESQAYFTKLFHRQFHVTPSDYRKRSGITPI